MYFNKLCFLISLYFLTFKSLFMFSSFIFISHILTLRLYYSNVVLSINFINSHYFNRCNWFVVWKFCFYKLWFYPFFMKFQNSFPFYSSFNLIFKILDRFFYQIWSFFFQLRLRVYIMNLRSSSFFDYFHCHNSLSI